MERKDKFITKTQYVDEETGLIIPEKEWSKYITIKKKKTYEKRKQHEVVVIWTRIVRRSPQLEIEFD